MKNEFYIGNTDHDWFNFCRNHMPRSEINFWQPSKQHFRVLDEGGVFFFRRKSPINLIGGFGVFVSAGTVTIGTAWRDLGISNGVESLESFIEIVRKYKRTEFVDQNTLIGFKLLTEPVFLNENDYFELPLDWSPNIVSGKGYSSVSDAGRILHTKYLALREKYNISVKAVTPTGLSEPPSSGYTYSEQKVRIGQSAFRLAILGAYEGRCAVTGTAVENTLEAAHLLDYAKFPDHSIENGILLRKDIHSLFDAGFLLIDQNYRIRFSNQFKDSHSEATEYLALEGKKISLPRNSKNWPSINKLFISGHLFQI
ncbi:hypothetical protein E7681_04850 [Thalassobius vesicularis]|uniref:HNH nuclease domain-containing protein n=1 Tax=Thalassobius vesicularis TaxID=1294297 RepID=A0A4S3MBQ5_9RHOB|nr:HNH endonuclease [Thalassobius vesicularis]THD75786.1 hypothetical protein E7681_04850 [Thalassobius vesicularis]